MLLEEDESKHHEEEQEEDDASSSSSAAAAAAAAQAATFARLDISPVHVRRRRNNIMIHSEPKSRLRHGPYYYSFDYDDDDDDDDDDGDEDDSGIYDDHDNDRAKNDSKEGKEEDWTRTVRHPDSMLFQQGPLLRRRPIGMGPPPPFPSLLDSTSAASSAATTTTITDAPSEAESNSTGAANSWRRTKSQQQQQQQQYSSPISPSGRARRLWAAFPRPRQSRLLRPRGAAPPPPAKRTRTRWLISATHPLKLCWDLLTVLLSLANAYATHAAILNREFVHGHRPVFLRFCEIWFAMDILLNFCTTRQVPQTGIVLQTWQAVWARYLTSWFVIDVLSLFPAEILYIQPIIEAQKRRGWLQKLNLRSQAVARVTSRLLRHKFVRTWARPVLYNTKRVVGMGVVTTIRKCIYFIPKYLQFVRNMKGVIALRALRQVHWVRNVYLSWWNNTRTSRVRQGRQERSISTPTTPTTTTTVVSKRSRLSLRQRLRLPRQFRSTIRGDEDDDDDTENLTEDGIDNINTINNTGNPDWEFLRDDDPF
jgi:hypothetical protein